MNELEEMRSQLTILKEKLEKETIVSDKLLREITRQKVRRLNRAVWMEGIGCVLLLTFGNWIFRELEGCSWWFIGGTSLMVIVCFLVTIISHRRVKQDEIISGDLLQVAKQVRHLRKLYQDWKKISVLILVAWFAWFCWEFYINVEGDLIMFFSKLLLPTIGLIIGGIIGFRMQNRYIGEMDDIVNQIEEA